MSTMATSLSLGGFDFGCACLYQSVRFLGEELKKKSHQIGHFKLLIMMFAQCLCTLSQTEWIRCNVSQIFMCSNQKHCSLNRLCAS